MTLLSSTIPCVDPLVPIQNDKGILLQLTNRTRNNFCAWARALAVWMWNQLRVASLGEDVKIMTLKNMNIPGALGSLAVYALLDVASMHVVMVGEDSSFASLTIKICNLSRWFF